MGITTTGDHTEPREVLRRGGGLGCAERPEERRGRGTGKKSHIKDSSTQPERFCQTVICSHYEISREEKISMQMRHRCEWKGLCSPQRHRCRRSELRGLALEPQRTPETNELTSLVLWMRREMADLQRPMQSPTNIYRCYLQIPYRCLQAPLRARYKPGLRAQWGSPAYRTEVLFARLVVW